MVGVTRANSRKKVSAAGQGEQQAKKGITRVNKGLQVGRGPCAQKVLAV